MYTKGTSCLNQCSSMRLPVWKPSRRISTSYSFILSLKCKGKEQPFIFRFPRAGKHILLAVNLLLYDINLNCACYKATIFKDTGISVHSHWSYHSEQRFYVHFDAKEKKQIRLLLYIFFCFRIHIKSNKYRQYSTIRVFPVPVNSLRKKV